MTRIPRITLNDGAAIPQLGFGVFRVDPEETERIVSEALEAGYRHLDTAQAYRNEEGVGRAIAASGIPREELYITTKQWNHGAEATEAALAKSLTRLGIDRLDLFLIHWPRPELDLYVETWRAFERAKAEGLTRSIGVSNFLPHHLERLAAETETVPAVDQIELRPGMQQREVQDYARAHGIAIEAWGPLGGEEYPVLELPIVQEIAAAHRVTPAQAVIRWHLQHGVIVFPKSSTSARIRENFDVFGFDLSQAEMAALDALDDGAQRAVDPDAVRFS